MENQIANYNFKEGLPLEFEILNISKLLKDNSSALITPHRTDFYLILWFEEGYPTHFIDFKPIKIRPNTLLFINKNSIFHFDKNTDFKGQMILFTDNFFCETEMDKKYLSSSILFNDLLSVSKIDLSKVSPFILEIFQLLQKELQNPIDTYQSKIIRNHLKNILHYAERQRKTEGFIELQKDADLDLIILFKNILEDNFKNHRKVSFYCSKMHLTPKRLNRATTKVVGKTPKEIIDERILLEIKRLLVYSTESIKEIGSTMGFDESTNFIKYFKKHTSTTPLRFRETI